MKKRVNFLSFQTKTRPFFLFSSFVILVSAVFRDSSAVFPSRRRHSDIEPLSYFLENAAMCLIKQCSTVLLPNPVRSCSVVHVWVFVIV